MYMILSETSGLCPGGCPHRFLPVFGQLVSCRRYATRGSPICQLCPYPMQVGFQVWKKQQYKPLLALICSALSHSFVRRIWQNVNGSCPLQTGGPKTIQNLGKKNSMQSEEGVAYCGDHTLPFCYPAPVPASIHGLRLFSSCKTGGERWGLNFNKRYFTWGKAPEG